MHRRRRRLRTRPNPPPMRTRRSGKASMPTMRPRPTRRPTSPGTHTNSSGIGWIRSRKKRTTGNTANTGLRNPVSLCSPWLLVQFAVADRAGRGADANLPGRQVCHDGRAGADDDAVADRDVWTDEHVRGQPDIVADRDRLPQKRVGALRVIVRARAEVRILANHGPGADRDRSQAIDDRRVADLRVLADAEIQGDLDGGRGPDAGRGVDG